MLHQFNTPQTAQGWCHDTRKAGKKIGYVATMGALHAGHVSLFQQAQRENDVVIVSIFVNPLQFNKKEDLDEYPRDEAHDVNILKSNGINAVFTGSAAQILGDSEDKNTDALPDPGIYAKGLEGRYRPGHFEGVREVVLRLFGFVGPCRAYFGEKDYQQVKIIEQIAANMKGVIVVACQTDRESSGLARSSRNFRLSAQGLQDASIIYRSMQLANQHWQQGERHPSKLQQTMIKALAQSKLTLEYAEVRDPKNWTTTQPSQEIANARVFVAGSIDGVRLIDNMPLA